MRKRKSLAISRGGRGFTLIEMMLAVAILGLVMVMLAGSFHAVAASKVHAENRLETNHRGRTILWEMGQEIRGAVQTPFIASHVLLIGQGRMMNRTPLDSITVSTIDASHTRTVGGFGAEQIVTYSAAPNPDHRGWYLLLRTQTSALLLGDRPVHTPQPLVLAANVLALHVRYFDGTIWNESWDSRTLPPGRALPLAVSIELEMAAPGSNGPMDFFTQVSVPMAVAQW
jgi:prepilin-type N-terminal cleavage/methylation domain-containing protein